MMAEPQPEPEGKVFQDAAHGTIIMPEYCCDIIDTPEFQRLRAIKQLGGAEYVYPSATHTRFAHSLGVCHLAQKELAQLKKNMPPERTITDDEEKCVVLAGLCHDLGHGPLSHKFEAVVKEFIAQGEKKWTHEQASVDMLTHLNDNRKKRNEQRNVLTKAQIDMISDIIRGMPERGLKARWKHYEEKRFLYQIISNSDSGIDVDKWDYLRRDCLYLGIPNNFDHNRVIEFMHVLPCKRKVGSSILDTYEICFRDKVVNDLGKMFTNRWNVHEQACQHRVVKVVEQMFTDALVKYFKHNKEQADSAESSSDDFPTIKKIITDMTTYCVTTDRIVEDIEKPKQGDLQTAIVTLEKIKRSESKEGDLQTAIDILKRIKTSESKQDDLQTAREILDRIKRRGFYTCIWSGKPLKGITRKDAFKAELIKDNGKPYEDYFTEDNLVVIENKFNYGKGDKNPLEEVFVYKKLRVTRSKGQLQSTQLQEMPLNYPEKFQHRSIAIYSRKEIRDDGLLERMKNDVRPRMRKMEEEDTPKPDVRKRPSSPTNQALSKKAKTGEDAKSTATRSLFQDPPEQK